MTYLKVWIKCRAEVENNGSNNHNRPVLVDIDKIVMKYIDFQDEVIHQRQVEHFSTSSSHNDFSGNQPSSSIDVQNIW